MYIYIYILNLKLIIFQSDIKEKLNKKLTVKADKTIYNILIVSKKYF